MITICKAKTEDIEKIKKILENEGVDFENIKEDFLVVYEKNKILGLGGYKKIENVGILNYLRILEKNMELVLKDGLIKALLNLADLNKIKVFLVKKEDDEMFYKKIGFNALESRDFILNISLQEKYLYIKLADFFNHPCKGNE